ncbi:MAG TPA: T9SS type A sorting domain-containing protein [Saprospiraceae bacterium]|nr:T9SS type A sorting domain-containing protein [Saprospiraceae bacterium]
MKSILILSIELFLVINNIAQSGYNKTYDYGVAQSMLAIRYYNDSLNVYGIIFFDTQSRQKCFIVQLDTMGGVLKWINIEDPKGDSHLSSQPGGAMIKNGKGIVVPVDLIGQARSGIGIINNEGILDSFVQYDYGSDRSTSIYSVIECYDGDYIFTGWASRLNYDLDAFVLKTTADGEKKWLKYYGVNGLREIGFSIVEVNENEYVIGGVKDSKSYIFAIDSLGNKKWEWMHPDTTEVTVKSLHKEANGDWTYLSHTYRPTTYPVDPPYLVYIPMFIRRDSSMNLLVRKEIGPYAYMNEAFTMIPSRDGGWITAGTTSTVTDNGPADSVLTLYGRVVKLDEDGDSVWEMKDTAFFSQYFSKSYLSGIAEAPTGSIYAVGYSEHPTDGVWRSYGWLLKITADGCVDTLCTTTSLLDQLYGKQAQINVYPNPTAGYVIFDLSEDIYDRYAEIFDMHGRRVARQVLQPGKNVIMLNETPGLYAWRVEDRDGDLIDSGKLVLVSY